GRHARPVGRTRPAHQHRRHPARIVRTRHRIRRRGRMSPRPTRLYEAVTTAMDAVPGATVSTLRETRTFANLRADTARRADLLDAVAPRGGSRILVTLANHPDYVATLLAIWSRADLPILADPSLGAA